MTTFIRTVFVACLVLGLSAPFAAGQDQDVEGSKDHPLISRYPGSVITKYLTKEFDEFTLPLGQVADENKFTKSQPSGREDHPHRLRGAPGTLGAGGLSQLSRRAQEGRV